MRTEYILFFTLLFSIACTNGQPENTHQDYSHHVSEKYTCPMHPQIVSDKPGTCSICGMDLVKTSKAETIDNVLMLNDSQIKLANITTQKVEKKLIGQSIAISGRLAVDERQSKVISSRVAGKIEKLYIKETGKYVKKGEPLYILYSETLLTLQQEYLLAKEQSEKMGVHYRPFFESSRKKLELYGMTSQQINELADKNSMKKEITFLAPSSGVVAEINATEGEYISEGALLYKLDDVDKLWVEAELYASETSLVRKGDKISVAINGDDPIEATIIFLSPEFIQNSQVTVMRAAIDNANTMYKPGEQVQIYLKHSAKEGLSVPTDAVIRNAKGMHVYQKAGNNTFRPVMVKTGIETFDDVEITEGLAEGDTIVVSGAYLLYSEFILKKGTDPAVHNH
jgi:Cu(I)/Ag(I) efflux system membrane fusion protein